MTQQNPNDLFSTPGCEDQPVADGAAEGAVPNMLPPGGSLTNMITPASNPTLEQNNPWRQGLSTNVLPMPPQQPWQLMIPRGPLQLQPAVIPLEQARYRVLQDMTPGQDIGLRDQGQGE